MSVHRAKAAIIGLLEADRAHEWVVTEKLGNSAKQKNIVKSTRKPRSGIRERYVFLEWTNINILLFWFLNNLLHNLL